MPYLVGFDEALATSIEYSGGKGANLARLTQNRFPVPPGFIVTAQAYRDWMGNGTEIRGLVSKLSLSDATQLRSTATEIRSRLAGRPLPSVLTEEVRRFLERFPPHQAFSVRSSSTMEDLALAAFAGMHNTFLNCSGLESVLNNIKLCFLSLWSERAIAYRQRQSLDHLLAAMAVVVQEMVPCDVAGVGFSINPVTGDLGEILLNANYGLGESVVGGEGEIDQYAVDKAKGTVRESRVGRKTRKIIAIAGGTKEVPLSSEEALEPCLRQEQVTQLAHLIREVEDSYRFPQDIEWGFAGRGLYLLQSRPVTTIPPRWTREESAERFPNVITPLTWDFVEDGFHRSLNFSLRLMGYPPFSGKWFGMHGHYIYGNQNAVELYLRRPPVALTSLEDLRAAIPQLRENFRWVQELPVHWSRDLDYYLMRIGGFLAASLEQEDLRGVWAFVLEVKEHGAQYFLPNIAISITQASLYRLLHHLLGLAVGESEAAPLFDGLLAFCETKTGIINEELFEMARHIQAKPELERLVAETSSPEIIEQRLLDRFPEFQARFQKFLRDHGHREVDFDAYRPTWVEAPWVVLDNLRLILTSAAEQTPAGKKRELKLRMQQAELELFSRLPADLRYFFHEILRLARAYTGLDDTEHYQTTRLTLPLRKGLRELGERLGRRGVLEEPMDVFFARAAPLDAAVHSDDLVHWRELSEAVYREKAEYLRDKARTPEWVLGEPRAEAAAGDEFKGLPGSPGQAEGPVFIVLDPDDFSRFPKGAVLVARTTNPTWTPLFYSAAAVITESGGPLSHGAVTAREMQIPAVMSVRECLARLQNGQRVRVDGTRGSVQRLGEPG